MSQLLAPARRRRAPARALPAPITAQAAAKFNGIYMRPNLGSDGTVPAGSPYCTSPDVWVAGTSPVGQFETALATSQSYATTSQSDITEYRDNYIYLRGANGSGSPQSRTAQLYYAPSAVIQWPGRWENNVIQTDNGTQQANIAALSPGAIGVADQPFLWKDVQPPPPGSDHYCLIAQLNDVNNSNPVPPIDTQLDMAALIANNLGWAWRNISLVSAQAPTWSYEVNLSIPDTFPSTQEYRVLVQPTGYTNWYVSFQCSRTDANGKQIKLDKTQITQDGIFLGLPVALEPGFSATMSVYLYDDNHVGSKAGAKVPLSCTYTSSGQLAAEAVERGLVDWRLMDQLYRLPPGDPNRQRSDGSPQIGPTAESYLGTYSSLAK